MNLIETSDGRQYLVVEGEMGQDGPYFHINEEKGPFLAGTPYGFSLAVIADELKNEPDPVRAADKALRAIGAPIVRVRRLPNETDPQPAEGLERVYKWNGRSLVTAPEQPSRAWYERQRDADKLSKVPLEAAVVLEEEEMARIDALEAAATTIAQIKTLHAPEDDAEDLTPYEKRANARANMAAARRQLASLDEGIAARNEAVAALDRLGRDELTAYEIEQEVANPTPTR